MSYLLQLGNLNHVWIFGLVLKFNELPLLRDQNLLLSFNNFVFAVKFHFILFLSNLHCLFYNLQRLSLSANACHRCSFRKDCTLFGHSSFLFKDHRWRAVRLAQHSSQRRLALDGQGSVVIMLLFKFLNNFARIFFILNLGSLLCLNEKLVNHRLIDGLGCCFARFYDELGIIQVLIFPFDRRIGRQSNLDLFRNNLDFMWLRFLNVKWTTILLA